MHVASLSPLSVGGFAWSTPDPSYTVVLKATFTLDEDGPLNLALQQSPMTHDHHGPGGGEELLYGSDFAPRKVGVDVLLVGHARGREPSRVIPFGFELGELKASLYAVNDSAQRRIPLWSRYVRRDLEDPRSSVQLAPRPTASRSWRYHLLSSHFDFTAFNAAAVDHRLDELPLDATLKLHNLLLSSEHREVMIGDTQPYVFYVRDTHRRDEVDLLFPACDTVWIDTDRERLTLCWRCEARPSGPYENPFLAVVLGTRRRPPSWDEVRKRLIHARWHEAVEPGSGTWSAVDAGPWGAPAWPLAQEPSSPGAPRPSSDPGRGAAGAPEQEMMGRETPLSPPAAREHPLPMPRPLDDQEPLTPRSLDGQEPLTPRSLDDEQGPPTPRSLDDEQPSGPGEERFELTERTQPVPPAFLEDGTEGTQRIFDGSAGTERDLEEGMETTQRVRAAEEDGDAATERPQRNAPSTPGGTDPAPSSRPAPMPRRKRHTEPCPPPEEPPPSDP